MSSCPKLLIPFAAFEYIKKHHVGPRERGEKHTEGAGALAVEVGPVTVSKTVTDPGPLVELCLMRESVKKPQESNQVLRRRIDGEEATEKDTDIDS